MRIRRFAPLLLLTALTVTACERPPTDTTAVDVAPALQKNADLQAASAVLDLVNARLAAGDHGVRVAYMEYLTDAGSGRVGQTVFADDRGNKQLTGHFVPGDPRRGGHSGITFLIDSEGATSSGLAAAETSDAIRGAMATWEAQQCSELPLTDLGDAGMDLGLVQFSLGAGGSPNVFADLTHAGWLPGTFFDLLAPDGSDFILGVTFTLVFENPALDSNGDGKFDVGAREIYYNDAFGWDVDGDDIDVETVALHEAGHGLSQGHFGKIFGTNANGKIHFAPLAVMNAAYSQVQHDLEGTDAGGHCSIWSSWP